MGYMHRTGTPKGSFPKFVVKDEIVLTSVQVRETGSSEEVTVSIEIGWDNSGAWDMGELEIMLRRDRPDGEIVYWSPESCFASVLTRLQYKSVGGASARLYYLTVRSPQARAVISGPYWLQGTVRIIGRGAGPSDGSV